jgi:hypothetical protein
MIEINPQTTENAVFGWIYYLEEIFSDLFSRRKGSHKEIVTCLASGPKDLVQVCKELGKSQGGLYSQYLDEKDLTFHQLLAHF